MAIGFTFGGMIFDVDLGTVQNMLRRPFELNTENRVMGSTEQCSGFAINFIRILDSSFMVQGFS